MIPNIKLSVKRVGIRLYDDRQIQIYFISISYIYTLQVLIEMYLHFKSFSLIELSLIANQDVSFLGGPRYIRTWIINACHFLNYVQ